MLNNTDELNRRETTPISNPLTPLAQAVEYVEAEENQKLKRRKLGPAVESNADIVSKAQHLNNDKNHDIPSEDEEELDFWETMRNLTELPNNTLNNTTTKPTVTSSKNILSHDTAYHNSTTSSNNSKILTSTQFSQKPVSQHHPLHYYNSNTRENTPKPVLIQSQARKETGNAQGSNNNEGQEEGLDEEDKLLAREVAEVGVDQETLNSYGLFYNVYTREGSTFPELQPQQSSQQQQQQQQQQQKYSVYDQWGGGFGMIPFNPS